MKTKLLYHGTKSKDIEGVMNNPRMAHASDSKGYGLYLTDDLRVASAYGSVIAFEVPYDFEVDIMRPVGYEDTAWDKAMEFVINTQATYVKFMKTLEDVYPEPFATPF